ncbi:MAG: MerC domain-containing protein [Flavobacteriales bacterium]|nr:MerC domain-containing protein [Flavobacteriales bacterium]
MASDRSRRADLLGMTNSVLCLAHCLAMPLLVAMGAAFLHHPLVSVAFIAVAAWAVHGATRRSVKRVLTWYLWSAWVVFGITLMLEDLHHGFEIASLLASAALVLGHLLNRFGGPSVPAGQDSLSSSPSTMP